MTAPFDFTPLFKVFGTTFQKVKVAESYRDYSQGGKMVTEEDEEHDNMSGIVMPLTDDDLRYDEGGTYTRRDVKISVQVPDSLNNGDQIIWNDKRYKVTEEKPYDEYADFRTYIARRVDMEERGNND